MIGPPIRAAGGVVWRRVEGIDGESGVEVAVIHRPRYDDWSLPKGKVSAGESDLEGAVREVLEETGFHVRVGRGLGETRYVKGDGAGMRPKVVRWWAMQAEEGSLLGDARGRRSALALPRGGRGPAQPRHRPRGARAVRARRRRRRARSCSCATARPAAARSGPATTGTARSTRAGSSRRTSSCGSCRASRSDRSCRPTSSAARPASSRWPMPSASRSSPSRCCPRSPTRGGRRRRWRWSARLGDAEHDAVACSQGEVVPDLVDRLADGRPLPDLAAGHRAQGLDLGAHHRRGRPARRRRLPRATAAACLQRQRELDRASRRRAGPRSRTSSRHLPRS